MALQLGPLTQQSVDEILKSFATSPKGLDENEVKHRLQTYGPNIVQGSRVTWVHILLRQFRSPFVYLLLFATIVSIALHQTTDALFITLFIVINTVIGFYQEYHSERTLRLLQTFVVQRSHVKRGDKIVQVESKDLVPGDCLVLEPGDLLSSDVRFIETNDLSIDESVLTGESAPVHKSADSMDVPAKEVYAASNIGFSGTTIASGKATAIVVATGKDTSLGGITKLATETKHTSSFEIGIGKFSTFILRLVVITIVLMFFANLIIKHGQAQVGELFIFSVALAVSAIPEALPVVTTFSLSRGALRLAKHKVVVKRLSAIEDLGSIEVLCTDKTGTLTENKLTVAETYAEDPDHALFLAALASPRANEGRHEANNSFDVALWNALPKEKQDLVRQYKQLAEVPFDPERRRNSMLIQSPDGATTLVVRGATEPILPLCSGITEQTEKAINAWIAEQGLQGQRVLAIAIKDSAGTALHDDEHDLHFVGLLSFVDPIKKSTLDAVKKATRLGVQIKILTGDGPEVAGAVAKAIGLVGHETDVMTGAELEQRPALQQLEAVKHISVFARVSPEEKYRIIQLLEHEYQVGFLGEGINDAPALKMANVAIVVDSASDVAREASDIMLLEKGLNVIVDGIHEGREVFANTTKYIKSTLASNFGNFYTIAVVSMFIDFLPMLPIQILLVNLLSDFPMIAVATDSVDVDEVSKPKSYDVKNIALIATLLGLVSTVFDFVFLGVFFHSEPKVLQTMWFLESILTELIFIYSIRTKGAFWKARRPSTIIIWLTIVAAIVTVALPYMHIGQQEFHFARPETWAMAALFSIVASYFIASEGVKLLYYRFFRPQENDAIVKVRLPAKR